MYSNRILVEEDEELCPNKANGSFESSLASSLSEIDNVLLSLPLMSSASERIQLDQWSWYYRGEGAANLVISLKDGNGIRKIARFSKSKYKDKDNNVKIDETAFYANTVMTSFFGSKFIRPVTVGIVEEDDFETVKIEAQPFRPLARCKKDIRSRKVIISPDCVFLDDKYLTNTFGDTFSIEVKPKFGFHTGYPKLCTRCLKQEAKLQEGDIDTISQYCPLDLFSGDLTRMKRALFDLYENPHNRFKIFKNGQLIYTEKIGIKDEVEAQLSQFFKQTSGTAINTLASVVSTALLGQDEVNWDLLHLVPKKKTAASQQWCDTSAKSLPPNCILSILLNLQKLSLEVDDITAEALSDNLMSEVKSPEELHNLTIWYPLLISGDYEKMLEEQGYSRRFIEDLKKLQKFLLSVTAKDVSLLLTFRAVQEEALEKTNNLAKISLPNQQTLRVMTSVIDLDPKPVHRIPTWIEKRQDWLKSYLKN